ncbi:MAG: hypothetical protein U1D30_20975 [Planctomycetota bacterium]
MPLKPETIPPAQVRPWTVTTAGQIWLDHLLQTCVKNKVQVTILQPPCPPFVAEQRVKDKYYEDFHRYMEALRERYPTLGLDVIEPKGYDLDDFADDHHLTPKGSKKLTATIADWVLERYPKK